MLDTCSHHILNSDLPFNLKEDVAGYYVSISRYFILQLLEKKKYQSLKDIRNCMFFHNLFNYYRYNEVFINVLYYERDGFQ